MMQVGRLSDSALQSEGQVLADLNLLRVWWIIIMCPLPVDDDSRPQPTSLSRVTTPPGPCWSATRVQLLQRSLREHDLRLVWRE